MQYTAGADSMALAWFICWPVYPVQPVHGLYGPTKWTHPAGHSWRCRKLAWKYQPVQTYTFCWVFKNTGLGKNWRDRAVKQLCAPLKCFQLSFWSTKTKCPLIHKFQPKPVWAHADTNNQMLTYVTFPQSTLHIYPLLCSKRSIPFCIFTLHIAQCHILRTAGCTTIGAGWNCHYAIAMWMRWYIHEAVSDSSNCDVISVTAWMR